MPPTKHVSHDTHDTVYSVIVFGDPLPLHLLSMSPMYAVVPFPYLGNHLGGVWLTDVASSVSVTDKVKGTIFNFGLISAWLVTF